jgi:anaerobic magnesium-protoporphyrin IX monomethyl ester cyclase
LQALPRRSSGDDGPDYILDRGTFEVRVLLVALNARYVHTSLALRYLRAALEQRQTSGVEVQAREFSINDHLEYIAGEIYEEKPDLVAFSCYIWNIRQILVLVRNLRPVLPGTFFLAGGPEVAFDGENLLQAVPQLDAVITGEGERAFPALVENRVRGVLPWEVENLVWRLRGISEQDDFSGLIPENFAGKQTACHGGLLITNPVVNDCLDLNDLPNPYAYPEDFRGRLVYVETSRGCPFRCEFCLSGATRGIRYLEPEKFRLVLRRLFQDGAGTVKFVDRTFNADKRHAFAVLNVFREEAARAREAGTFAAGETPRAHCEMAGELLDDEWMAYLKDFPPGMLQVEIGVQSTYRPALQAVKRPQNFALWKEKARTLQQEYQIPVHLDLIAGLPREGWQEFRNSFNEVIAVTPNRLQLGFLKVLKGSGIRAKSHDYGLVYAPEPPYTVLKTKDLTHAEVLALKRLEEILEKYYNSGKFHFTMQYLLRTAASAFDFFHSFARYWQWKKWFGPAWNTKALFANLWDFLNGEAPAQAATAKQKMILKEILRFDFFLLERPGMIPVFLQGERSGRDWDGVREKIKTGSLLAQMVPDAREMDRRQWARATAAEYFAADSETGAESGGWYLFYYGRQGKTFYKVNDLAESDL